MISVQALAA